ncbi:serine hydrolase [Lentimicrobium sp. L6]|uniref:serine hydrolase n=1 Tax=Lentimicrobium sp. L6 TaxID=2735916 RepID=UPI001551980C|nr:serine hydrolase [Lentimicrobium sp. L6]NPD86257.1 serine hydrolase [Lentimicrobium sp. L6]
MNLYNLNRGFLTVCISLLFLNGFAQNPANHPDTLDTYLTKAFTDFELHGLSVMVIKDDKVVFDKNWGTAGYGEDVGSESLYNIASCTKAFTGAAMAKLVNDGLLHWDDLVIDYLPEFKLADPYITTHLTIEDLLVHRSGLGTFYGDLLWYETNRTDEDVIERLQYLPITNRFRDQYGYQNTMYMVAGEILKKVTGQTWEEYIQENLLDPLKMESTVTCGNKLEEGSNIAYPMIDDKEIGFSMKRHHAAASIFSSTADLSLWVRMLLNNGIIEEDTILPAHVIRDMMAPRTMKSVNGLRRMTGAQFSTYALGWNAWDHNGEKVVEHAGGMPGYISQVTLVPQENLGIIILTNTLTSAPTAMELYILDSYLKEESTDWASMFVGFKTRGEKAEKEALVRREESRVLDTEPSLEIEKYLGTYEDKMYGKAIISLKDKQLHLVFEPAKEMFYSDMEHWHFDTFKVHFADPFLPAGYVSFDFDSRRNIEGFKIDLKSNDFHFFNLDFKKLD